MPRPVEEIAADLDSLEAEEQGTVNEGEVIKDEGNEEQEGSPPGYLSHDEWIAAGKDPDDYRGKNAYKAQYDGIQDNKALKADIQGLKGMLTDVVDAAEQTRLNQAAAHKAELEAKLAEHLEMDRAKEAVATQNEINAIDDTPKPTAPHPMIANLITANPLIDQSSNEYNEEFALDFWSYHDAEVKALGGHEKNLSDIQIKKLQKQSMAKAKELNPEIFTSSRNNRGGTTRTTGGKKTDTQFKLSDYKIDDNTDPRNQNAATAMYEMIKAKSPEKAEQFRKNLLGAS